MKTILKLFIQAQGVVLLTSVPFGLFFLLFLLIDWCTAHPYGPAVAIFVTWAGFSALCVFVLMLDKKH